MATFSDAQLVQIVKKAARRINRKLRLVGTTDEISIDNTGEFITPDDDDLRDLVLLQAECLISTREFSTDLSATGGGGVMVRDGEQTLDTRQRSVARGTFYNSPYSPCAELEEWIKIEQMHRFGGDGKLVW